MAEVKTVTRTDTVMKFIQAIYGEENYDLILSMVTEEDCLRDATELIHEVRKLRAIKETLECSRDAWIETAIVYALNADYYQSLIPGGTG